MSELSRIENHWGETVAPAILEQYRERTLTDEKAAELGCDNRWQAMLKAVIDQLQDAEDAACAVPGLLDFKTDEPPTGGKLELLASLLNVKRMAGESDGDLFKRFLSKVSRTIDGTPDGVIEAAKALSGDAATQYVEEAPATFFVYTPNGTQLKRKQVKKLAPAGVLGLPGAAIRLGNGNLLKCHNGKTFIVAALDYKRRMTALLVDDEGNELVDENGNSLLAVLD